MCNVAFSQQHVRGRTAFTSYSWAETVPSCGCKLLRKSYMKFKVYSYSLQLQLQFTLTGVCSSVPYWHSSTYETDQVSCKCWAQYVRFYLNYKGDQKCSNILHQMVLVTVKEGGIHGWYDCLWNKYKLFGTY